MSYRAPPRRSSVDNRSGSAASATAASAPRSSPPPASRNAQNFYGGATSGRHSSADGSTQRRAGSTSLPLVPMLSKTLPPAAGARSLPPHAHDPLSLTTGDFRPGGAGTGEPSGAAAAPFRSASALAESSSSRSSLQLLPVFGDARLRNCALEVHRIDAGLSAATGADGNAVSPGDDIGGGFSARAVVAPPPARPETAAEALQLAAAFTAALRQLTSAPATTKLVPEPVMLLLQRIAAGLDVSLGVLGAPPAPHPLSVDLPLLSASASVVSAPAALAGMDQMVLSSPGLVASAGAGAGGESGGGAGGSPPLFGALSLSPLPHAVSKKSPARAEDTVPSSVASASDLQVPVAPTADGSSCFRGSAGGDGSADAAAVQAATGQEGAVGESSSRRSAVGDDFDDDDDDGFGAYSGEGGDAGISIVRIQNTFTGAEGGGAAAPATTAALLAPTEGAGTANASAEGVGDLHSDWRAEPDDPEAAAALEAAAVRARTGISGSGTGRNLPSVKIGIGHAAAAAPHHQKPTLKASARDLPPASAASASSRGAASSHTRSPASLPVAGVSVAGGAVPRLGLGRVPAAGAPAAAGKGAAAGDFHEEFMAKSLEWSLSWREEAGLHPRAAQDAEAFAAAAAEAIQEQQRRQGAGDSAVGSASGGAV